MQEAALGLALLAVLLACLHLVAANVLPERSHKLRLLTDDFGNECLVLDARVGPVKCLFLLDTAYAGAPVLSTSYMAALLRQPRINCGPVRRRFALSTRAMADAEPDDAERRAALGHFLGRTACRSFTAGCTLRLMSIGSTTESHADMLLCPPARFSGVKLPGRWDADIFVTHPGAGSLHILTSDYLLHHAPCLIQPAKGRLCLRVRAPLSRRFDVFPLVVDAGAFLVPIRVGDATLQVVVDTGASAPLSLSRSANLVRCEPTRRTVQQSGVNGETICSDIVSASVTLGSHRFESVDVLFNSHPVEGADGYLGMGLLRCFDIYVSHACIAFLRSGLLPRRVDGGNPGQCGAKPLPCSAKG